jgi:hypothetical protein
VLLPEGKHVRIVVALYIDCCCLELPLHVPVPVVRNVSDSRRFSVLLHDGNRHRSSDKSYMIA